MHLRQAAFEKGGCAIELTGKNDNLIKVENHGVVSVNKPGKPFEDEEYKNFAWTGSGAFRFSDELASGDDENAMIWTLTLTLTMWIPMLMREMMAVVVPPAPILKAKASARFVDSIFMNV